MGWHYAAAAGGIINSTDVVLRAAAAAGIRNYVASIEIRNAHATVATEVVVVPTAASGVAATEITGGVRLSGDFSTDAVRLQVFKASSASLAAPVTLGTEPTALPWHHTGQITGQTRCYWLRSVSPEGNVSAFAGPVTATVL